MTTSLNLSLTLDLVYARASELRSQHRSLYGRAGSICLLSWPILLT